MICLKPLVNQDLEFFAYVDKLRKFFKKIPLKYWEERDTDENDAFFYCAIFYFL